MAMPVGMIFTFPGEIVTVSVNAAYRSYPIEPSVDLVGVVAVGLRC